MSKKRLFLIDAYALIFRAYYAFIKNPIVNSKGFETSAILGFFNSIFEIKRSKVSNRANENLNWAYIERSFKGWRRLVDTKKTIMVAFGL